MQGGTVSGHSEGVGKGATFTIRLPLVQAGEVAVHAPAESRESRKIFIVDDNRDAADTLAMLLQIDGHCVEVAYSAEHALERFREFAPDIALLDIGLPGMNGYELARHIRELGIPGVRLVALSGYGQPEDRARAQRAGFDAHLVKPVELDRLKEVFSPEPL
jgi:CheY-like chemotaxis protein